MPVLCGAIKLLFDNWEKDFPGKNKPIFYIAGEDLEGGTQRAVIENFKANDLSKEGLSIKDLTIEKKENGKTYYFNSNDFTYNLFVQIQIRYFTTNSVHSILLYCITSADFFMPSFS